jgi:hypothetical protein
MLVQKSFTRALAIASTFAFLCGASWGQGNLTAVAPLSVANQEAPGSSGALCCGGARKQFIYDGSNFAAAMPLGGQITQIAFRVDGSNGNAVSGAFPDIEVRMFTGPSVAQIGRFPTDYVKPGADNTIVFPRGSLQVESTWSLQGPNPFLVSIPLKQTFGYNPAAGSLVVDFQLYQGFQGRLVLDIAGDLSTLGIPEGFPPVMEVTFIPVPEPSSWLIAAGFTSTIYLLRRGRKA